MTVGYLVTGRFDGVPMRELLHWAAYSKIEREQMEKQSLAASAKAGLSHYRGKV